MTGLSSSPRLLKAGIVLMDAQVSQIERIISLQYNPDSLSRTLQAQVPATDAGGFSDALRLKGPPIETIKLDAEIDATDQLEFPDQNLTTVALGIYPQLAALEATVYPSSATLELNAALAQVGTIEIMPAETPLMLFVWSAMRILPVRLTEFTITEEAFDIALNPIRAKVSLGMRVLSVDDLGFAGKGGGLFMSYLRRKEQLAARGPGGTLGQLGLTGIP